MSEARTGDEASDSSKVSGSSRAATHAPQVEIERLEENGSQTIIGFSGIGVDGAALAIPRTDVGVQEAREIAHDVVDAAGGVA